MIAFIIRYLPLLVNKGCRAPGGRVLEGDGPFLRGHYLHTQTGNLITAACYMILPMSILKQTYLFMTLDRLGAAANYGFCLQQNIKSLEKHHFGVHIWSLDITKKNQFDEYNSV